MLTVNQFQKKYPGSSEPVLCINDLNIETGIYWIKGGNGAGKTSFIKCIAGLLPFEGSIAVNGTELKYNRMAYTKMVNYAEAEPLYPAFLSGKELLDFYKSCNGGTLPAALINDLGIDAFMHNKTAVYSSGMMKKLSLALAFTGAPKLVLLDEPLIALDTESVEVLQQVIYSYSKKGVSFIITSHQPLHSPLIQYNGIFSINNKTLVKE